MGRDGAGSPKDAEHSPSRPRSSTLHTGCGQDVSGGSPVPLQGTSLPLWALEIDPEREKDEFVKYTTTGELGVWRGGTCRTCIRHGPEGFGASRPWATADAGLCAAATQVGASVTSRTSPAGLGWATCSSSLQTSSWGSCWTRRPPDLMRRWPLPRWAPANDDGRAGAPAAFGEGGPQTPRAATGWQGQGDAGS